MLSFNVLASLLHAIMSVGIAIMNLVQKLVMMEARVMGMDVQAVAKLSSTGIVLVLLLLLQHAILYAGMERSEDLSNVMIGI